MKNRASSFPAELRSPSWYRQRWPWLLIAGPFVVVVASLASAWIAVRSDDGLVAEDYYKQGLLINQKLAHMARAAEPAPDASVSVEAGGVVRVRLRSLDAAASRLRLILARPGEHHHDRVVQLARTDARDWTGAMPEILPGRWLVTLESDAWRLPETTVIGPFDVITLGAGAAQGR
jgi:uncharacterized protein